LLDNKYPRIASLNLINSNTEKEVSSECRNLLYRCVHPRSLSINIERKKNSQTNKLVVDLINTLSTMYAMLHGYPVFKCTDGFLRDILSSRLKVRKMGNELLEIIPILDHLLNKLNIQETVLVIDKPIPWSKKMANSITRLKWTNNVKVEVGKADTILIEYGLNRYTVATSDIVILQRIEKAVDLSGILAIELWGGFPEQCSIPGIIDSWYTKICSGRDRFIKSNSST
jgi:hypothetical protein